MEEKKRRKPPKRTHKRLTLDLPPDLIRDIKIAAAYRVISMKRYVMYAIIEKMTRDKQYE